MALMFYGATAFNQLIGDWDTGNVTVMGGMFGGATAFNQPIGRWDTGNVTRLANMFGGASNFNQPIGGWDTGKITAMSYMFRDASGFNQDVADWDVSKVTEMTSMFQGSGLSTTSFDKILVGWSGLPSLQPNVALGADGIQYSCAAKAAHQSLTRRPRVGHHRCRIGSVRFDHPGPGLVPRHDSRTGQQPDADGVESGWGQLAAASGCGQPDRCRCRPVHP